MQDSTLYFSTCALEKYSHLFFSSTRSVDVLSSDTLNWNPNSYLHMIWKSYLEVNVIVFTPLNKVFYHFINLGLTFIFSFLHSFGISSWCLYSHSNPFRSSISFLFWMIHWVLCSFCSNIIPWSWFYCAIHHIGGLKVK